MAEISAREQKIFDLASMEWELFQLVHNTGGRASCQDDPDTFFKMRMSQWMVYSDSTVESCMRDFQESAGQGRNLIFEKYGRMMETTHPEEYERVKQYFPEISEKHREAVEEIVAIHLDWDRSTAEAYPYLRKNGRLATTGEDSADGISMESYLRGELQCFSEKTVEMILEETKEAVRAGVNLQERMIENEVRFYGYESLERAEEAHREQEE